MATNRKGKPLKPKRQERQLTISSVLADSDLGLTLEHLNSSCEFGSAVAAETLTARLAPFVVPKDTPGWQALAIRSANSLEAWAKSIREYGNLPPQTTTASVHNPVTEVTPPTSVSGVATPISNVCDDLVPTTQESDEDNEDDQLSPADRIKAQLKQVGLSS